MRRNIGSRITPAAAERAQATARGPVAPSGIRTVSSGGTSAGLRGVKSARLEHSKGGYNNPANQSARLGPKDRMISRAPGLTKGMSSINPPASILDTRLTRFSNSSIAKLRKLL